MLATLSNLSSMGHCKNMQTTKVQITDIQIIEVFF